MEPAKETARPPALAPVKHANPADYLHPQLKTQLQAFCRDAEQAIPGQLVSVVVYGDAIQPELQEHPPQRISLMIVVKDPGPNVLEALLKPLRAADRKVGLAPMIIGEEELNGSTDVFPIKFLLMQRHHVLLQGKDVLKEVTVSRDHLRLRCEQEMRNLMLRMRLSAFHAGENAERMRTALQAELSGFLNALSGALILKHNDAPIPKGEVVALAARAFGLEEQPLIQLMRMRRGAYQPGKEELRRLQGQFMGVVRKAVQILDHWS